MKYFIIVILALGLTSCFDILEEINFNLDGSGTYSYKINLGKHKFTLDNIVKLDSIGKYKIPSNEEIQKELSQLEVKLNKIEGVSNTNCLVDLDYYIFTIKGSFKNVTALNKAYTEIYNYKRKEKAALLQAYSYENGIYERRAKDPKTPIFAGNTFLKESQFSEGKVMTVARFPMEVSTVSNSITKISKNGKAVMTICDAVQFIKKPSTINCTVKLK